MFTSEEIGKGLSTLDPAQRKKLQSKLRICRKYVEESDFDFLVRRIGIIDTYISNESEKIQALLDRERALTSLVYKNQDKSNVCIDEFFEAIENFMSHTSHQFSKIDPPPPCKEIPETGEAAVIKKKENDGNAYDIIRSIPDQFEKNAEDIFPNNSFTASNRSHPNISTLTNYEPQEDKQNPTAEEKEEEEEEKEEQKSPPENTPSRAISLSLVTDMASALNQNISNHVSRFWQILSFFQMLYNFFNYSSSVKFIKETRINPLLATCQSIVISVGNLDEEKKAKALMDPLEKEKSYIEWLLSEKFNTDKDKENASAFEVPQYKANGEKPWGANRRYLKAYLTTLKDKILELNKLCELEKIRREIKSLIATTTPEALISLAEIENKIGTVSTAYAAIDPLCSNGEGNYFIKKGSLFNGYLTRYDITIENYLQVSEFDNLKNSLALLKDTLTTRKETRNNEIAAASLRSTAVKSRLAELIANSKNDHVPLTARIETLIYYRNALITIAEPSPEKTMEERKVILKDDFKIDIGKNDPLDPDEIAGYQTALIDINNELSKLIQQAKREPKSRNQDVIFLIYTISQKKEASPVIAALEEYSPKTPTNLLSIIDETIGLFVREKSSSVVYQDGSLPTERINLLKTVRAHFQAIEQKDAADKDIDKTTYHRNGALIYPQVLQEETMTVKQRSAGILTNLFHHHNPTIRLIPDVLNHFLKISTKDFYPAFSSLFDAVCSEENSTLAMILTHGMDYCQKAIELLGELPPRHTFEDGQTPEEKIAALNELKASFKAINGARKDANAPPVGKKNQNQTQSQLIALSLMQTTDNQEKTLLTSAIKGKIANITYQETAQTPLGQHTRPSSKPST